MNYQPPSNYNSQAASWQAGVEPTPYTPPAYSSAGTYPAYNVSAPSDRNQGSAMAGLILGLISLLLPAIVYFVLPVSILSVICLFLGFPISIVGLIFSIRGRRSLLRKGMATAGLVLSIIGLLLALGYIILVVLVASRS